jgi:hypothetical protein
MGYEPRRGSRWLWKSEVVDGMAEELGMRMGADGIDDPGQDLARLPPRPTHRRDPKQRGVGTVEVVDFRD